MPFVSWSVLILTLVLYVAGNPPALALWPIPSLEFYPWQVFTYAFLHASPLHLVVNLLALLSFGPSLERSWGHWRFLCCYMLAAAVGGTIQASLSDRPVVGASAALFGLFAAWVMDNPKRKVVSLIPWPLAAWQVLLVYVIASIAALAFGWLTGMAHAAHLGGVMIGMSYAGTNNKPRN